MSQHKRGNSSSDEEWESKKIKHHHMEEEESHSSFHPHRRGRHGGDIDEEASRGQHRHNWGENLRRRHEESSRHRDRDNRHRNSRHNTDSEFNPHRQIKQEPVDISVQQHERRQNEEIRREARQQRERGGEEGLSEGATAGDSTDNTKEKEKPNFELSGKLTEDTNTYRGVVIKYNEPPEARKPKRRWRLYPFKGDTSLPMLAIHRQSAYLLGRDRRVADIPVDHPSCSKQHAVLQFRLTDFQRPDGSNGRKVRPYIIDLGSANGTYVNNQRIDAQHYVELFERDVVKFGFSSREYVLLHENVDTSEVAQKEESE